MLQIIFAANNFEPDAIAYLQCNGLGYKQLQGCYKGTTEVSFLVCLPDPSSLLAILKRAVEWRQESVLLIDSNNSCRLLYLNNFNSEKIGAWRSVSRDEAIKLDAWSFDGSSYYIAA